MKNLFADVSAQAARLTSPLNITYENVAPDTKPTVSKFLNNLDRNFAPQPAGM